MFNNESFSPATPDRLRQAVNELSEMLSHALQTVQDHANVPESAGPGLGSR